jgi:hypothetical protein
MLSSEELSRSRRVDKDVPTQGPQTAQSLQTLELALTAIAATQKCAILLTDVPEMDNEPGHEGKVFVLKQKQKAV